MAERLFCRVLREVRKSKDLTQGQLGDRMGVSQSTVSGYESGEHPLSEETMDRAAEAMGMSTRAMFELGFKLLGPPASPTEGSKTR